MDATVDRYWWHGSSRVVCGIDVALSVVARHDGYGGIDVVNRG
jgi:hypothetical protein